MSLHTPYLKKKKHLKIVLSCVRLNISYVIYRHISVCYDHYVVSDRCVISCY